MMNINAQYLPGSPSQTSSHPVCLLRESKNSSSSPSSSSSAAAASASSERRSSIDRIRNASLGKHKNEHFHSPTVFSNGQSCSILNAPKPSLEISEDNILFGKKQYSVQLNREPQNSVNPQNITRTSLIPSTNQPKHRRHHQQQQHHRQRQQHRGEQEQPTLTNHANFATYTPSTKPSLRYYAHETIRNSALVGAPRLALSVSFQSGQNNPDEHMNNMSYSPINSSLINVSTSLSYGDGGNHGNDDEYVKALGECSNLDVTDNDNDSSVPSNELRYTCVEQAKCSNLCQMNGTSVMAFRCRICLEEGEEAEQLLSACRCKGTVGLVHKRCLEKWLLTSGQPNCELCGYAYIMTPSERCSSRFSSLDHLPRFSNEMRSVRNWLNWQRTRRHLIADVICMILLTPATYIGVYLCVLGALDYTQTNPLGWQVFGLWGLAVLLILLLTIWMILVVKHHLGNFRNYQYHQQEIALAEAVRLSALPRYRFSVQPRPRGSSVVLCNLHREEEISPIPSVCEAQISSASNMRSVDLNQSYSSDQSPTSSRSVSS
ncbi:unnamed protein product [Heterobilharzia americana]|nr:unnamed protein product [Heterobilharzia americana]CAH8525358.1 unnamed protein product [Heterobilharzia americana]CAH8525390.1 unnamed protein product [Heterobilharzia americana]